MSKSIKSRIIAIIIVAGVFVTLLIILRTTTLRIENILLTYQEGAEYSGLTINYPLNETLFPPEITAPTFRWKDEHFKSDAWLVAIRFQDDKDSMNFLTRTTEWTPAGKEWETIKHRSLERNTIVTILGVNHANSKKILSGASISIRTSRDEVGAPLFYREINLPFIDAVKDSSHIRWRFGTISSKTQPPIVLENLPVCGNCHSFSADGTLLGMDVDYANDKGSYAIVPIAEEMILEKSKIITWSDYKREDKERTYGLLSQISPDGKYVVSTVKDRSVFVAKPGLDFSQLFFPVKGILAIYCRESRTFKALPGADDKRFVQSNPSWSPDGRYIVFTRSKKYNLKTDRKAVLLNLEECREFVEGDKTFLFDLYRIPFNNGKGGKAEPIEGASNNGMSNYFAKYSPDGKWIVFCKAKSFSLLQPDSKLYIMPAKGGNARMMRCNTSRMNSWHSWTPNSRWLVFSSKANTPYTQLFLTHIDEKGCSTPPVVLAHLTASDRAANIPEFINVKPGTIKRIREQFLDDKSFVRAGNEFFKGEDYERAIQVYRKALELNPKNVEASFSLASILLRQGKLEESEMYYRKTIKLDPKDVQAHNNLGIILANQGKSKEALYHYNEALRLDTENTEAYINLGILFQNQGKHEEAVRNYKEALRLDPDSAIAHNNLGNILATQGKLEEAVLHYTKAIRIYTRVLKLDSENVKLKKALANFHVGMGNILVSQGKNKEAITYYTKALKLDLEHIGAHNNLGVILARQGKYEEAIVHYTEALRINPNYPDAHYNLGDVLSKQGRHKEAIRHFNEASRLKQRLKKTQPN